MTPERTCSDLFRLSTNKNEAIEIDLRELLFDVRADSSAAEFAVCSYPLPITVALFDFQSA